MQGKSFAVGPEYSGKIVLNFRCSMFQACERCAKVCRSAGVADTEPVVISSAHMNDSSPTRLQSAKESERELEGMHRFSTHIFATLQLGFQLPT